MKVNKIILISILYFSTYTLFAQDDYVPMTVDRNNVYSLNYFSSINNRTDNVVVSPFGIASAMAMLYIGSEENTQKVIAHEMNFITPFGVLYSYKQLIKRYQIFNTNDINLLIGNGLWIGSKEEIQKKYKNLLKVNFGAHVQEIDFNKDEEASAKLINRWVKKSSNFNLLSIIKPEDLRTTDELVFTNYVFLDGAWDNPFSEQLTSKEDFFLQDSSRRKVDFMNQTSYLKYNENEVFQIVELPYSGSNLSMVILLPKSEALMDSLESLLNPVNFDFWTSELYSKLINLSLPKFRVEQSQSFSIENANENFKLLYSDNANYASISKEPIHFSRLIQKTIIQVVENKNNSNVETFGPSDNKKRGKDNTFINFKANHPFLFIIRDKLNDCILMVGKINTPGFNNLSADYYK